MPILALLPFLCNLKKTLIEPLVNSVLTDDWAAQLANSASRGFHKLDKTGNNANIDIGGFTM